MKAKKEPLGPLLCGLLILLVSVGVAVGFASPKPLGPDEQLALLRAHLGILYFIDAQNMAKQICPDPSLTWSHDLLDKKTGCGFVGNGVWFATGLIDGPPARVPSPPVWEALFRAEEGKLLYLRVGSYTTGDFDAAMRQAGYARPKGAPGGK